MTKPTLIIGLGGTGRQTLMQVRRMFLEDDPYVLRKENRDAFRRQYSSGRMPHVELLSIDTDERLLDLDGEPFDSVLAEAALSGREVLDIKIVREKVEALHRERNAHPNYLPWYDFSLPSSGLPEHGAGQTRPWGRLAFFHNYREISDHIKDAMLRLLSSEASDGARLIGLPLDNDMIKVQLVFSIAGGTGSGMFLDTAFLIRKLAKELGNVDVKIEAVILLPNAFSSDHKHRVFANAYAALMEIEYYNRERDKNNRAGWFPILWEGEYSGRGKPKYITGPTFDIAWLVGNTSRGVSKTRPGTRLGTNRGDKSALTGMMADWLYRRCAAIDTAFGNNINSYLIGNALAIECDASARLDVYEGVDAFDPVDGGFDFSRRFGSFGLSKLHAPSSLVQEKFAHRLVFDIVGDWLQNPVTDPPVVAAELGKARAALNLHSPSEPLDADNQPMDMRVFALSRSIDSTSSGQSLLDVVKETAETDRATITSADDFEKSFTEWRRRFRQQKIADDDPAVSKRGDFAREVVKFSEQRATVDAETLDELLTGYLNLQGRGIGLARAVLEGLKNDYDHVVTEGRTALESESEAAGDYDRAALERLPFYEGSRFVRTVVARVCFSKQRDAFLAEIGRQIYEQTIALAAANSKLVSAKIRELDDLQLELLRLQKEIENTANQLDQRPHSKLNRLIVGSGGERYCLESHQSLDDADVRWSLLKGSPAPDGPWPIRESLTGAARARLRGNLIAFAKDRLDHVLRERTDVLGIFDKDKTDTNQYQAELRPLVENATSWIDVRHEAGRAWEANTPMRINRIVARAGTVEERERLMAQLDQVGFNSGAERTQDLAGPVDQLIFEEHMTGFPLFEVASLKTFRDESYDPIMTGITDGIGEYTNAALHLETDIDKYSELVKPDSTEAARTAEAMGLFLRALMFGVLKSQRDERTDEIIFSYERDFGLKRRSVELGKHSRVLRILARENSTEAREIEADVQAVEAKEWSRTTGQADILALLDYYVGDKHPLSANRLFVRTAEQRLQSLRAEVDQATLEDAKQLSRGKEVWYEEAPAQSGYRRLLR